MSASVLFIASVRVEGYATTHSHVNIVYMVHAGSNGIYRL